MICSGRDKI